MHVSIVMAAGMLLLAAAVMARVAEADDAAARESLLGGYVITSGEESGQAVPEERLRDNKVRITADSIVVSDQDGKQIYVARYTLNTDGDPYGIAMTATGTPTGERGATAKGLLKVEGDTVWLIYATEGGQVPTEFTTKPGSKQNMFVLKRANE